MSQESDQGAKSRILAAAQQDAAAADYSKILKHDKFGKNGHDKSSQFEKDIK